MVRSTTDLGLYLADAARFPSYDKQRTWLATTTGSGATSSSCSRAPGR